MKPLRYLALSICLITLSSCQTWDGLKQDLNSIEAPSGWSSMSSTSSDQPPADLFAESGNCPQLEVVSELDNINEFSDISDPQPYNLIARGRISKAENSCTFSGKTATVDVKLAFEGMTGPKNTGASTYSYPFFVAVTAPNGNILAKEVFSVALNYGSGQNTTTAYESMRQIIPIANQNDGPRYKVLVGFQLTQDQLAYNRAIIAQQKAEAEALAKAARMNKSGAAAVDPYPMQTQQEVIGIGTQPAPPVQQPTIVVPPPGEDGPIVLAPQNN